MRRSTQLAMMASLGVLMAGGLISRASAQDVNEIPLSVRMEQMDVRDALDSLFKAAGVSYTVDPDVQGFVTLEGAGISFETALQAILRQVNATYCIEGGIWNLKMRSGDAMTSSIKTYSTGAEKVRRKVYLSHADPALMAMLIGTYSGSPNYFAAPELSSLRRLGFLGSGFGTGYGNGAWVSGGSGRTW